LRSLQAHRSGRSPNAGVVAADRYSQTSCSQEPEWSLDRDAYEVLQLQRGAHQVVIHAAYRALAAEYHPDHDPSMLAHKRMTELNAAYALIRTRELREAYDVAPGRQQAPSGQGAIVRPPP